MATNKTRISILAVAFSAASLVSLVGEESYTSSAIIPVKGDVPTVGFGSTYREDGSRVQMGDTTTPPKALARTMAHIRKDENGLRACIRNPVTQGEYDLLVKFSYQFGAGTTCKSGIVRNINNGDYKAACAVYLEYKRVAGRDCSLPENWGPRGCRGVWLRAQDRYETCMAEQ